MINLILELRRRKVFRSLGLYVGISWLVIQASSVVLPAFEAPSWTLRGLIVLAIIGFPLVAAVAWFYDITGSGLRPAADLADIPTAILGPRAMDFVVIGVLVSALAFSVYLNLTADSEVESDFDPVTVLIADFDNATGEAVFDGVLEQLLMLGLEAAPHVALFERARAEDLAGKLDTTVAGLPLPAARLIAVRQAIAIVLEGSVEPADRGYRLRIAGIEPVTGEAEFEFSREATERDRVPENMASLSRAVRQKLGGTDFRDPDRLLSERAEGYSVTSLEAAKLYADANRLGTEGDFAAAADLYRRAAELQPDWPAIFGGWAITEFNRGRIDEAESLFDTTLSLVGDTSETDRLFYLGSYFTLIREDYENALETMSEYVELAPASSAGRNNLAVIAFLNLDFTRARQEGERLVDLFPRYSLYRTNLALYAMYGGDFEMAAAEAREVLEYDPEYGSAYLALAIAALEDGDPDGAIGLYRKMASTDFGVKGGAEAVAATGIVDAEIHRGRFGAAREALLENVDRAAGGSAAAQAMRQILLAETYSAPADRDLAIEAAHNALALSEQTSIMVAGALVLLASGELEAVEKVADDLSGRLPSHSRAYGLMLTAAVERERGRYTEAVDLLRSALAVANLWRIRLELGRTYLEAGNEVDALREFEQCRERQGEATAMFLDDVPTYRYLTELPYWIARAQTALGMNAAAGANYAAFLSLRPEGGAHVDDARTRLADAL